MMGSVAKVTTGADLPCEVELTAGGLTTRIVFDQPGPLSDGKAGPTSSQAVSAALASCTAVTLRVYAERKEWDLTGLEVEVRTGYEGPNPSLFEVFVSLPDHLDDDQRERLTRIAGKCPVHRLLAEATPVEVRAS